MIEERTKRVGAMLYSELRGKEVINIEDCKRLGKIADFELDECTGQICKIIIPACSIFTNWFRMEPDWVIPYKNIKQIGPDIILVQIR